MNNVEWKELNISGNEPERLDELFNLLFLNSDEERAAINTVDYKSVYYFCNKLMSKSPKEQDQDPHELLSYSMFVATVLTLRNEYSFAFQLLEWARIERLLKIVVKVDEQSPLITYSAVLYSFLKNRESILTDKDVYHYSKITFGELGFSEVCFGIDSKVFADEWKVSMPTSEFFGWSFEVLAVNSERIALSINLPVEEVIESYVTSYIETVSVIGLKPFQLLSETLNKTLEQMDNTLLKKTVDMFSGNSKDRFRKYIKSIKKTEIESETNRENLKDYINTLIGYSRKDFDLTSFLIEVEKKKYLIPLLDFTHDKEFLSADEIIKELLRSEQKEAIRLAGTIYEEWLEPPVREKVTEKIPFYIAYVLSETNQENRAIELYQSIYEKEPKNTSVINNLAILYYDFLRDYDKGLDLLEKGLKIDPTHKNMNSNIKNVKELIEKRKKRPQEIKDRYFKKIDKLQRNILFSVYKLSGDEPVRDDMVQSVTKLTDSRFYKKHIKLLLDLELLNYSSTKGYELDEIVYELVQNFINPKIEREVVRASRNILYRPIFFHESEIRLYQALIELFPQQLVFPNMDLKAIIEVDKVKEYLDPDVVEYMFKAHVDFAIINNTNYLPILCIEKDSSFQDEGRGAENTLKKNIIFSTSGLPLIRIRFTPAMDQDRLREEIKQTTKEFLLQVQREDDKRGILKEFDLKRFGIYNELPTDEELGSVWEEIVGEMFSSKTQRIELNRDESILYIYMEKSLEQVLEYGKESIKAKLYEKLPALNSVQFIFV